MSIVTFEEHTEDLTDRELAYLPLVQEGIEKALKNALSPRKQHELILLINEFLTQKEGIFCDLTMNGPRLRKFVNHLRTNSILPIIATSQGYSLSERREAIELQIKSLQQRARQILRASEGLEKYLNQKK